MFCGNCGSQIQDGSAKCPVCGALQPMAPAPRPAPPVKSGVAGTSESGWGFGLRIFAWFFFFVIILAGVVLGIFLSDPDVPLISVGCIVGGLLVAFFSVASIMVHLNQARDTAEIRDLLRQINAKMN